MLRIQDIKKDLIIKNGAGGNGIIAFSKDRNRFSSGGNGGEGGPVFLKCSPSFSDLSHIKKRRFIATRGMNGENNSKTGKKGKGVTLEVPCGTTVVFKESSEPREKMFSCFPDHKPKVLLNGGGGGRGNESYARKIKERSFFANRGLVETEEKISVFCRPSFDGIILGLENSGKSTFLNALTSSKAEIRSFPFTTKELEQGTFDWKWKQYLLVEVSSLLALEHPGKALGAYLDDVLAFPIVIWVVDVSSKETKAAGVVYRQALLDSSALNQKKQIVALRGSGPWTEANKNRERKSLFLEPGAEIVYFDEKEEKQINFIREKIVAHLGQINDLPPRGQINDLAEVVPEETPFIGVEGKKIVILEGHLSQLYVGGGTNKTQSENQARRLILQNKPLYSQMMARGLSQGWVIKIGDLTIEW